MVGYLQGGLRTFGLGTNALEATQRFDSAVQRLAPIQGSRSNARAGVNVNRVSVNGGRSYVGSDSLRAAASALGSSYPIPIHDVSRNGICICMYVCMYGVSLPGPERCRRASAGSQGPGLCGGTCMSRSWVAKLEHVRPRGRRRALPSFFPGEEIRSVRE